MDELQSILNKYHGADIDSEISTFSGLVRFSARFYRDVAEIYDAVTRIRNVERNPTGFNLNDAAILGLLVRIWKILKEVVHYYEGNNADIISLLDRQIVEAAVVAKYLLISDDAVAEDYRKCSYKDRLRVLDDVQGSPDFFQTPPGKRLLFSINSKMQKEGLTEHSFVKQKTSRWKLQGKNFYEIFSEVEPKEFYKFLYGIPSESIHGSWNHSMDYDLVRHDDGTFTADTFYQAVDVRFVTPILRLCRDPYLLWLKRIDAEHDDVQSIFEWIRRVNIQLFERFEQVYADKSG